MFLSKFLLSLQSQTRILIIDKKKYSKNEFTISRENLSHNEFLIYSNDLIVSTLKISRFTRLHILTKILTEILSITKVFSFYSTIFGLINFVRIALKPELRSRKLLLICKSKIIMLSYVRDVSDFIIKPFAAIFFILSKLCPFEMTRNRN